MVVQKKVPLLRWTNDFDQALNYLQEHFNVIHSYKQNGEILLKQNEIIEHCLKRSHINVYPKYIETRKNSLRDTYFNINQRGDH